MNKYEVLYIVTPELEDEAIKAVVEKFSGIIAAMSLQGSVPSAELRLVIAIGGEVEQVDEWGRKKLAYPIDYKTEGYYVLVDFAADPQLPRELERNFKNDESILRYMVTRKEA